MENEKFFRHTVRSFLYGKLTLSIWVTLLIFSPNALAKPLKSDFFLDENRNYLSSAKGDQSNGDLYWQSGNVNKAISVWKKEASIEHDQNRKKQEIQTLLKIARGYNSLGKFYPAITELEKVIALAPSDSYSKALTRRRLGNAYSGIGRFNKAISNYKTSLKNEKSLSTINDLVEVLLNKEKYDTLIAEEARQVSSLNGDTIRYGIKAKSDRDAATEYAKIAFSMSNKTDLASVRALINWNELSAKKLSWQQLYKGEKMLKNLPFSRNLAFTILNWADVDRDKKAFWLFQALKVAKNTNDTYLKSYVFLELGYFQEKLGNLQLALDYAQKAQSMAQSEFAYDSLFRAQQLAGRIYQNQGDKFAAITAYKNAIASLGLLREDSLTINIEQRTSFSTEIEPIYRETLKLLLNRPKIEKASLASAIAIFDKLRLAQLQNYFGDNCFEITKKSSFQNTSLNKNSATINSIILDDRVLFILQLPNGKLVKSEAKIAKAELVELAKQWSLELNDRSTYKFLAHSRLFYDLIIRPFESQLKANNLEVIVFVHDGILRNLPMAALSDEKEFLAQKWASVSSIGLNFTPAPVKEKEIKAIAFGLQASVNGWTQLNNVASEIQVVQNITDGDKFLDSQFTVDNLYRQLSKKEYSVVHLATHGYFGGTIENSYILAYDRKISAFQLEDILSQSKKIPDLLVLSACETALGSDRSLLGLAGIAARSGVESTLGTLWQVQDDEQSQMIEAFYSYWRKSAYNKATALQKVQIEQIKTFAHPAKWSALNLIGNYQ